MGGVISTFKEWVEVMYYGEKRITQKDIDEILLKFVQSYDDKQDVYIIDIR